ncbi:hypothetical protein BGW39_003005 [Mortierella sp. 14UC]|nr:hypothetical protein BGW39_003005 [Mortierella sp. 14UC]
MYPNQAGRALDKENDIVTEGNAGRTGGAAGGPGGLHANLVKQSSLIGSRTPSKQSQQQQQQGLKLNPSGAKTPSKASNLGINSPAPSVLRQKTNYQLPPTAPVADNNNSNTANTNQKKKSGLARTFSTALESNNNNNSNSNVAPSTPVKSSDSRRLSLTKRGSAKARLVVHKDEPASTIDAEVSASLGPTQNIKAGGGGGAGGSGGTLASHRPMARPAKAPLESATTLLSIERSLLSEGKVIVGQAKAETKRRALTNVDDKLEIEYCPPPVEERPYEPDFEVVNYDVLKTAPPPLAYHYKSMDDSDLPVPGFELAPTKRPSRSLSPFPGLSDTEADIPVAKTTITADGHLDLTWSDEESNDENDGSSHPIGSISHNQGLSFSGNISSGRRFGIKDLPNEAKFRPPFDGFMFDLDGASSEDSLSEDEDDIFGNIGVGASKDKNKDKGVGHEQVDEFNKAFGLDDLEDESKVQAPFTEFSFEL